MARINEDRISILGRMVVDAARAISAEMGAQQVLQPRSLALGNS
jgi:hypothetical protein